MENPETLLPTPEDRGGPRLGWTPAFLIAVGISIIACAALLESQRTNGQPWANGVFVPEGESELDGASRVWSRRIPSSNFDSLADWFERNYSEMAQDPETHKLVENIRRREEKTERVIFAPLTHEELEPLVASGRAPNPGKAEVLAGPLVRVDSFDMDGVHFEVVGRISPYARLFLNVCLLPENDAFRAMFSADSGASHGWIAREGINELLERQPQPPETQDETTAAEPQSSPSDQPEMAGGIGLAGADLTAAGILGLGLAAAGGALAFTRLLRRDTRSVNTLIAPLVEEIALRPRLWLALHVILYGTFLLTMLLAMRFPAWNLALTQFVAQIFTEGELSFIGQAYASQDILRAAIATFYHNYVTATLLLTLAVSLIVPAAGVFKTWASFAFMGFAMSPLWTGTLSAYTYHSITMILEFEAYILASFAAAVYAACFVSGVVRGTIQQGFARGLRVMLAAAILSGCILATAACYEAVTLLTLKH